MGGGRGSLVDIIVFLMPTILLVDISMQMRIRMRMVGNAAPPLLPTLRLPRRGGKPPHSKLPED